MTDSPIKYLLSCTLFTCLGLAGGYMAGHHHPSENAGHGHGHGHGGQHEQGDDVDPLSAQALLNLGIEITEIEPRDFVTDRKIPSRIEATSETVRTISSPVSGVVRSIEVIHGQMVTPADVILTIEQDSMPVPRLNLVAALLDPEQRIKGLSIDDLKDLDKLTPDRKQARIWRNTLARFGNWPDHAGILLESLPGDIRDLPYTVGVIGELAASGRLDKNTVDWLAGDKSAGTRFLPIAGHLLAGTGPSMVRRLHDTGALEDTVRLRVPSGHPDLDVHDVHVRAGDRVKPGSLLAELHDGDRLHVRVDARGSDIGHLMTALESDATIRATPLIPGSGLPIDNLRILSIQDNGLTDGAEAHMEITGNSAVIKNGDEGRKFRSWKIRAGSRYLVHVPERSFSGVFVVPAEAVMTEGAERYVFVQNGDDFDPAAVVVLHEDDDFAVLSGESKLFPGDPVVTRGAFGLHLALLARSGKGTQGHGHSH